MLTIGLCAHVALLSGKIGDILFLRGGGVRIRLAHCKTRVSFYIGQLSYTCSTFLLRTPFTSFIYIFFRQILIIDIVG